MAILASIILAFLKPKQRIDEANDVRREVYARTLNQALTEYIFDTAEVPTGTSTTPTPICAYGVTDPSCVNVDYLVDENYLTALEKDVLETGVLTIGYTVTVDDDGIVAINSTYLGMGSGGVNSSAPSGGGSSSSINYAFTNGQLAADLLGQSVNNDGVTPDWTGSNADDLPSQYGLNLTGNIQIDTINHRLFVSDRNNGRILIFNLNASNQLVDKTPDFVLGQSSPYHSGNTAGQSRLASPYDLAYDSTRQYLFVGDGLRLMVFDVNTITNNEDAIYVLGQPNFASSLNINPPTASSLRGTSGVAFDSSNNYLYVGDWVDSRILIFNTTTLTNGQSAIHVLGQSNFTSNVGHSNQNSARNPHIVLDQVNKRLFVAEDGNQRVMVFDVNTITNGENAINVLGKPNYTYSGVYAVNQSNVNTPQAIAYDANNNRLFVGDTQGNRILVYDTTTITNGENAINVLGQNNFTSSSAILSQSGFTTVAGMLYDNTTNRLYAYGIRRVMIFDAATITNGEVAIDLIGQYATNDGGTIDWTTNNADDAPGPYGFQAPNDGAIDTVNHRLFIPDTTNTRILIYNLDAQNNLTDKMPDYVLGQNNLYTKDTSAITNPNKVNALSLAYDTVNQRLFALEQTSHRVLVYDVSTIINNEAPVYVLGQPDFTSASGSVTQTGILWATSIAYDSTTNRLFVAQASRTSPPPAQHAHRISVFDVTTITNGEPAINVLGQNNFTNFTSGLTASTLNNPRGLSIDEVHQKLFVADTSNRRVLVFDITSITDGEAAVNVLGQPDFVTNTLTNAQNGVSSPYDTAYDTVNDRLFVAQLGAHRVTIFDTATITDNEAATTVLGQVDFTGTSALVTQDGLSSPSSILYDHTNNTLYVSQGVRRISIFRN